MAGLRRAGAREPRLICRYSGAAPPRRVLVLQRFPSACPSAEICRYRPSSLDRRVDPAGVSLPSLCTLCAFVVNTIPVRSPTTASPLPNELHNVTLTPIKAFSHRDLRQHARLLPERRRAVSRTHDRNPAAPPSRSPNCVLAIWGIIAGRKAIWTGPLSFRRAAPPSRVVFRPSVPLSEPACHVRYRRRVRLDGPT